jgi:hypothetical protein
MCDWYPQSCRSCYQRKLLLVKTANEGHLSFKMFYRISKKTEHMATHLPIKQSPQVQL